MGGAALVAKASGWVGADGCAECPAAGAGFGAGGAGMAEENSRKSWSFMVCSRA
jgi:hypothetical protein